MHSVQWTTGAGLSGNFGSNTSWATSKDGKFVRGLDHLEKCLFSEPERGCCNQKSFMRPAFPALQIQLFFDGDTANYESTAHALEVWQQNEVSFWSTSRTSLGWKEAGWIHQKRNLWIWFFLLLLYMKKIYRRMTFQPLKSVIYFQLKRLCFILKTIFLVLL